MSEEIDIRRDYEIMILFSSEIPEAEVKKEIETIKNHITQAGGKVNFEDFWGKRKLAYPIQKEDFGYYHVMLFTVEGSFLEAFEKDLGLNKKILRHLVTIPPKEYQPITSGEVEASEDAHFTELRAKKAGKMRGRRHEERKPKPSAPVSTERKTEPQEETAAEKAERQKKLDQLLSKDLL